MEFPLAVLPPLLVLLLSLPHADRTSASAAAAAPAAAAIRDERIFTPNE
jgi:hypothetical protein